MHDLDIWFTGSIHPPSRNKLQCSTKSCIVSYNALELQMFHRVIFCSGVPNAPSCPILQCISQCSNVSYTAVELPMLQCVVYCSGADNATPRYMLHWNIPFSLSHMLHSSSHCSIFSYAALQLPILHREFLQRTSQCLIV